jgi:PEGA domain
MTVPAKRHRGWFRPALSAAGVTLAVAAGGCATVVHGTWEQLRVESDPPGATVRLSNGVTGITPVTFGVPRKNDLTVTIAKDGYATAVVVAKTRMSRAGAAGLTGDLLLVPLEGLGLVSAAIDANTGTLCAHEPNPVKVTLQPIPPRGPAAAVVPGADPK